MQTFFEKNKIFIGILLGAVIIGGFIYFSNRPAPKSSPSNGRIITEPIITESSISLSKCISYQEAQNYVGEYKCVTGKVDNVYISAKGNTFLNFCPDYRTCPFSAVIFRSDSYKFPNSKQYEGKVVEITGLIKTYQGRAEIILNDPYQLKVK